MSFLAYSEINLFCIAIMILLAYKVQMLFGERHSGILLSRVFTGGTFLLVFDLFWRLIDGGYIHISNAANWAFNMAYFLTSGIFAYFWFRYSETKQNSKFVRDPKYMTFLIAPMALLAVFVLSSYFTKFAFYIDDGGIYRRGPFNFLQMLFSYGPILFTSIKAFVKSIATKMYTQRKELQSLAVFVVIPAITWIIQTFFPDMPMLCVGITLSSLVLFISIQDLQISVDPLTGLNNRFQLERYLEQAMDTQQHVWQDELYLCILDMDHFKSINDKFGHIEGDKALRLFADILKSTCKSTNDFVARFGGDEFIIVSASSQEYVDELCRKIITEVHERGKGLPYRFGVTIGVAKYSGKYRNSADFINSADKEMYQGKQERR